MSYTAHECNDTRTHQQMQVCARMSVTIDPIGGWHNWPIAQTSAAYLELSACVTCQRCIHVCRSADYRQSSRWSEKSPIVLYLRHSSRTWQVKIAWHELIVKQIYHDTLLFSQQITCLNYGKICTRQAGRVHGQPKRCKRGCNFFSDFLTRRYCGLK